MLTWKILSTAIVPRAIMTIYVRLTSTNAIPTLVKTGGVV